MPCRVFLYLAYYKRYKLQGDNYDASLVLQQILSVAPSMIARSDSRSEGDVINENHEHFLAQLQLHTIYVTLYGDTRELPVARTHVGD